MFLVGFRVKLWVMSEVKLLLGAVTYLYLI